MIHTFAAMTDRFPIQFPSPGVFELQQPVYYKYHTNNYFGAPGYVTCGGHTGIDFTYISGTDLSVFSATWCLWSPGVNNLKWQMNALVKKTAYDAHHGNYVILQHIHPGFGYMIETEYSHLMNIAPNVVMGAWIDFYQPIGEICNGYSASCGDTWTGMHLHFEVRVRLADGAASSMLHRPNGQEVTVADVSYDDVLEPILGGNLYLEPPAGGCALLVDPKNPETTTFRGRVVNIPLVRTFPDAD